jgi:hypothetical protein
MMRSITVTASSMLVVAVTSGMLLSTQQSGQAHASVMSADANFCQYFPEFGGSVHQAERTIPRWRKLINGTDREMHNDAASLAAFLRRHPHAVATGDRWFAVYLDCNPDA